MANGNVQRFMGGSPLGVLVRLIFISLLVGAGMAFLGLTPANIYESVVRFIRSLGTLGLGALGDVGQWIVAGAIVVVPVWVLMRLFASRR
jgi:hypothetical protein